MLALALIGPGVSLSGPPAPDCAAAAATLALGLVLVLVLLGVLASRGSRYINSDNSTSAPPS
jgi:hypothetical protein